MLVVFLQWEVVPGSSNACRPKGTPAKPATTAGRTATGKVTVAAPAVAATPGKPVELEGQSVPALVIKTRHHFSSKLQRMSTVARTQVWFWAASGLGHESWGGATAVVVWCRGLSSSACVDAPPVFTNHCWWVW